MQKDLNNILSNGCMIPAVKSSLIQIYRDHCKASGKISMPFAFCG